MLGITSSLPLEACLVLYPFGEGGNTAPCFFLCAVSPDLPQQIPTEHLSFSTWMNTTLLPSMSWQSYDTCSEYVLCDTGGCCYLHLCYPSPCIYRAKLVKDYMSEFPTTPRINSVTYEFANRKQFSSGQHAQFCTNPLLSPTMHSVPSLPQPVLCVSGTFCDSVANLLPLLQPWENSTVGALLSSGESVPVRPSVW
jgi:hypothetical protein